MNENKGGLEHTSDSRPATAVHLFAVPPTANSANTGLLYADIGSTLALVEKIRYVRNVPESAAGD